MINVQNTDYNECFKWCLVRYLNTAEHNTRKITKTDKCFKKRLDFKDVTFPAITRDIHKIGRKKFIGISIFGMKINKNIQSMYLNNLVKKNMFPYY